MIGRRISVIFFVICAGFVYGDSNEAVIDATTLPDPSEIPTLGNGHIAFVIFGDAILMNGLYNGERGESHRARIPNYANIISSTMNCESFSCFYRLHLRKGFMNWFALDGARVSFTQDIYPHRFYNRAIINKVYMNRLEALDEVIEVPISMNPGDEPSVDLRQVGADVIDTIGGREVTIKCFRTNVIENVAYQPVASRVCVAHTNPPASLILEATENYKEYLHVTTVGRTEAEVRKEMQDVLAESVELIYIHEAIWEADWDKFAIVVDGNMNLNQIVHAAVFYLISSLPSVNTNQPNDPFYGLSPGGLGKGGVLYKEYQGHSFWDTEIWMHPPILMLNPQWSKDILSYRYNVRKAAADNAKNTGYKGYRFPWESGFTGSEVTPVCCPEVVEYQHHIISDIAFAVRSHLAATHDIEWFKTVGCDIAWNTAKFWESRVQYNETTKFYDIRNVMGPDEDHHNISNNGYTNVNAAINLYFGDFAGCACKDVLGVGEADYENFAKMARSLTLLYDAENDYHPQYEGYEQGTAIKQADAVMLGFPLQLPMDASTKRNNLLIYDNVTRVNGPAMTWAMHTIGFLDLHDEVEAAKVFERSYTLYTRAPFRVWSEVIPGEPGAGNFITGAGGFLQSVINGYGGIRLHFGKLTITNFYVPPASQALEFKSISYLNNRFSLRIVGDQATITFIEVDPEHSLKAHLKPSEEVNIPIYIGWSRTFTRVQELVIEPQVSPFGSCEMKETVMAQEAIDQAVEVEETDWILGSNEMPVYSEIPTLSNGHIGFVVNGNSILMNGLYNGAEGLSHRARVPNYSHIKTSASCVQNSCEYRLNMRHGYFEATTTIGRSHRIVQQIYAHRHYNRAIVNRITLERLEGTLEASMTLELEQGEDPGVDLTQTVATKQDRVAQRDITVRCFETNEIEDPLYQWQMSKVCVAHTNVPPALTLSPNSRLAEYLHITAIGETEAEVKKEIQDLFSKELNNAAIFKRHTDAWEGHWDKFGISVTGNMKLNQIIHASFFYLISNLPSEVTNQPNGDFYGLSPSGIGKGGVVLEEYQGHSFWDTEMWMHPPILLLNPQWSEDLLNYRYNVRQAAADNANSTGFKGYRFPWESGFTGREVTPPCCPHVVNFQHHIIADIAFAFRSHLAATHDIKWFESVGCDIAFNTAKFWESRVEFNETTRFYDINVVMGPDEDHYPVNNSIYTNVIAAMNLYFGEFAACACKDVLRITDEDFENFVKIAKSIKLLYDVTEDFHPQYDEFDDSNSSFLIKQADVVLLGFPLQFQMNSSTKRNNLIRYDKITNAEGPAMTWAMHTVGFLDLQDEAEAEKVFNRSYNLNTREPFKVWSESMPGVSGTGNFITGAGGFLQSIINGYGGVRLHFESLTISNFYVPPKSASLAFQGITYLRNRFSLTISGQEAIVVFRELHRDHPIKVTLKPSNIIMTPTIGSEIKFNRTDELVMEAVTSPFGECELKETVLGVLDQQDAGSAVTTFNIIMVCVLGYFLIIL